MEILEKIEDVIKFSNIAINESEVTYPQLYKVRMKLKRALFLLEREKVTHARDKDVLDKILDLEFEVKKLLYKIRTLSLEQLNEKDK